MSNPNPNFVSQTLRLHKDLHARIVRLADHHHATLATQLRLLLEDALDIVDRRELSAIARDMDVVWEQLSRHWALHALEDNLARALAKSTDQEVKNLARSWLAHRNGRLDPAE
jgi:hypothetical protein